MVFSKGPKTADLLSYKDCVFNSTHTVSELYFLRDKVQLGFLDGARLNVKCHEVLGSPKGHRVPVCS